MSLLVKSNIFVPLRIIWGDHTENSCSSQAERFFFLPHLLIILHLSHRFSEDLQGELFMRWAQQWQSVSRTGSKPWVSSGLRACPFSIREPVTQQHPISNSGTITLQEMVYWCCNSVVSKDQKAFLESKRDFSSVMTQSCCVFNQMPPAGHHYPPICGSFNSLKLDSRTLDSSTLMGGTNAHITVSHFSLDFYLLYGTTFVFPIWFQLCLENPFSLGWYFFFSIICQHLRIWLRSRYIFHIPNWSLWKHRVHVFPLKTFINWFKVVSTLSLIHAL